MPSHGTQPNNPIAEIFKSLRDLNINALAESSPITFNGTVAVEGEYGRRSYNLTVAKPADITRNDPEPELEPGQSPGEITRDPGFSGRVLAGIRIQAIDPFVRSDNPVLETMLAESSSDTPSRVFILSKDGELIRMRGSSATLVRPDSPEAALVNQLLKQAVNQGISG